jgi:galactokinase
MMGGGFGGCTINIVHKDKVEELIENVSAAYEEKYHIQLSSIITTLSDGVKRI